MSALAGAKFVAWSQILIAILVIGFSIWGARWITSDFDYSKDAEKKSGEWKASETKLVVYVIAFFVIGLAISFIITGAYELVSLDYQAYKMMLLK